MKKDKSKLKFVSKSAANVYVPATIIQDESYPFKRKDIDVSITIEGDKLIIETKKENLRKK